MAPVWEANHVWLIFVLTVLWTAYPTVFGSIASTLCVALFIAGARDHRCAAPPTRCAPAPRRSAQVVMIDSASAVSSVLTPFALGAAAGGIASGRVPVGNAAGDLFVELAEPDLDRRRRARWLVAFALYPRRACSSPPTPQPACRRADGTSSTRSGGARSAPAWSRAGSRSRALIVLRGDAPAAVRRPRRGRRAGGLIVSGDRRRGARCGSCSGAASSRPATPPRSPWRRRSPAGRSRSSRRSCRG